MKCMNCGAELTNSVYCPKCGFDVSVQKQAVVLSGIYYNQGLEKAQVRDLSGAIDQLKRSLKFNKMNIDARNLLGLVYFETGEVVAALSEWVISKNIQPEDNIAAGFIRNLQQDANRLDIINQTIKKYNLALENCLKGNEDVALIQLKKILAQNPKLIKGYHLLSLLYIHREEYERARRLLKKALQIDRTNTTTLRFLEEVDTQTGRATTFEPKFALFPGGKREENENWVPEYVDREIPQPGAAGSGKGRFSMFNLLIGIAIGAAAIWFLFIPAWTSRINRETNERIARYSSDMAVYSAQIQTMNDQIEASQSTVDTANEQIAEANNRASAYESLLKARKEYEDGSEETAANALAEVDTSFLSVEGNAVYDSLMSELRDYMESAFLRAGISAFNSQDYDTAITKFLAAYDLNNSDYSVLNYLAHSYRMNGDTENADKYFQLIIDTFPDSTEAENASQYLSTNAATVSAQDATTGTAASAEDAGMTEEEQYEDAGGDETGEADTDNENSGDEE